MNTARVLITGGGGQLASDLQALLQGGGQVYAPARAELDVTDVAAVDAGVAGSLHITNSGATSWHGFTEAIMELAGVEVTVEEAVTTIAPGAADRPLNGVLRSTASARAGLPALRPWRAALGDYRDRAGLLAGVAI